jgi:hypothetical protein
VSSRSRVSSTILSFNWGKRRTAAACGLWRLTTPQQRFSLARFPALIMQDNVSRSAAVHEGLIGPTSKSRGGYRLYDRDASGACTSSNKHNTVASPAHPILCAVSKSNFVGSALVRRYHQVVSSSRQAYQFKQQFRGFVVSGGVSLRARHLRTKPRTCELSGGLSAMTAPAFRGRFTFDGLFRTSDGTRTAGCPPPSRTADGKNPHRHTRLYRRRDRHLSL